MASGDPGAFDTVTVYVTAAPPNTGDGAAVIDTVTSGLLSAPATDRKDRPPTRATIHADRRHAKRDMRSPSSCRRPRRG